jgi:opacity protein-like surface antigen
MTMKRFLQGLIVTVAIGLSATVVQAQNYSIFVIGSGTQIKDNRSFYENFFPYTTNFAGGAGAAVGIELPLKHSKIFGLEFSYGYSQNNLDLTETYIQPYPTKSYGLRDNRFSGDLVIHSPSTFHNARPYLVLGAELDRYTPTSAALTLANTTGFAYASVAKLYPEDDGGVNIGGGIDYKLTSRLSVRLDVRDHVTPSPTLGLPYGQTTTSTAFFPISGDAHSIQYSIGLVYHFGREKTSTASTKPARSRSSRQQSSSNKPEFPQTPF